MIWNKTKKTPMSAFTVFSSDCILLNNLIDGLGAGQWGRAQPDILSGWAEPSGPQRKPRQGVGERRGWWWWWGGKDRLKAGPVLYTSKAYISSEQNNSFYFYAKVWGWMHISEAQSGVPERRTQTRGLGGSEPGGRHAPQQVRGRPPLGCVFPRGGQYLCFVR